MRNYISMKGGVKIIIKNLQKKIPIIPKRIKKAVLKALSAERIKKSGLPRPYTHRRGEITISFVDDKQIRELNLMYLGQNNPTDVLSFDLSEKKREILADIVVSTDTAIHNAKIFKTTPIYETYLYVIHGVLHILGYDDRTLRQRKIMQNKAISILSKLDL